MLSSLYYIHVYVVFSVIGIIKYNFNLRAPPAKLKKAKKFFLSSQVFRRLITVTYLANESLVTTTGTNCTVFLVLFNKLKHVNLKQF